MESKKIKRNLIKVCIVDDDKSYRNSLKKIFEEDNRISISAEYESGNDFIKSLNSPFLPDVCLIDVVLKDTSGIECLKKIKSITNDIHVIIMTAYPDLKTFSEVIQLGADYIEKGIRIESIIHKIVTVFNENQSEFIYSLKKDNTDNLDFIGLAIEMKNAKKRMEQLSPSQYEILTMKIDGKSIKEIAEILNISPNTVQKQMNRIYKKLNLPNLLEYLYNDY